MPPTYTAAERAAMFAHISNAIASGHSLNNSCAAAGIAPGTFRTWQATMAARGTLADARRDRSGRRAVVTLTNEEQAALREWTLKKEGSFAAAIEFFAGDPRCTDTTRDFINDRLAVARRRQRKPVWPASLRRCAQIPAGVQSRYHGPKAAQQAAPVGRYSLTVQLPGGHTIPLAPGFAWTFDDYSANEPYSLEYAPGNHRTCRQVLAGMDVYTQGWLGFLHVGKERDAYTAADVLDVIRYCIEAQGHVPHVIILERGRWQGNAVIGIEMANGGRWGSIEEAGIVLDYQFSSRGKHEIERGFDLLQTWCAGEAAGIGRTRGQMERETLNMLAVNRGTRDPRACRFLTIAESAELHARAAVQLNDRPKARRELDGCVVSADQLAAEQPFEKRPLKAEHRWLFHAVKAEAAVRENGNIVKTVNGREYVFHVNGVEPDIHLPNGYRVFIAFDPERPELGCTIGNRETGAANYAGWRLGQIILPAAPALQAAPRIDLSRDPERDDNQSWRTRQGATPLVPFPAHAAADHHDRPDGAGSMARGTGCRPGGDTRRHQQVRSPRHLEARPAAGGRRQAEPAGLHAGGLPQVAGALRLDHRHSRGGGIQLPRKHAHGAGAGHGAPP